MTSQNVGAVEKAVGKVVADFHHGNDRWWDERDVHRSLFYHLKQGNEIPEKYPTQLIRAEFTATDENKARIRGYYDLVILDSNSYTSAPVKDMDARTPWSKYLPHQNISVAIEVKLWQRQLGIDSMRERALQDIQKLTHSPMIENAYFLNFVGLDFRKDRNVKFYRKLVTGLKELKKQGSYLNLKILCAPSDPKIQIGPGLDWI